MHGEMINALKMVSAKFYRKSLLGIIDADA
jgi:hypothetical protein